MNKYKVSPQASTTFDVPESGDFFKWELCYALELSSYRWFC